MTRMGRAICLAAGALLMAAPAFSQNENQGQGQAVVTILPGHGNEVPAAISSHDLNLKVNGKNSSITGWVPLQGADDRLELVVLLDNSSRTSLGRELDDISQFVQGLPANTKVAIAYMQNGQSVFSGPLTTDHKQALGGLHLPMGGPGVSASPYFCLSDLAKRWPSRDAGARREVLMVTDGVDYYNLRYDPDDPYVQAAIADAVRARIVIYSIYWRNQGRFDRTMYANDSGQNLMLEVTQATGGHSYWEGFGNPVSFQPFLEDLTRRLQNQYEISFAAPIDRNKPGVQQMKLKVTGVSTKIDAPQQVFVGHPIPVAE